MVVNEKRLLDSSFTDRQRQQKPGHELATSERQDTTAPTGTWAHGSPLDSDAQSQWRQWANSRRGHRKIRQWNQNWATEQPHFPTWSSEELLTPVGGSRTDWMQARLVALAQKGDGDAAVTLTIQLRPGLLRLVGQTAGFQPFGSTFGTSPGTGKGQGTNQRSDANNNVLSTFYLILLNHDLQRRPTKIAANLILDTRQYLCRESIRSGRHDAATDKAVRSFSDQVLTPGDQTDLVAELAALKAALQSLPGTKASRRLTSELAYRSWVLEEPNGLIARQLSISAEVVNTRLHRLRSIFKEQTAAASQGPEH